MTDPTGYLITAAVLLAAITTLSLASLRGWSGWLDLKRLELQAGRSGSASPTAGARIELADLKERIRKLEAIAAGVDI